VTSVEIPPTTAAHADPGPAAAGFSDGRGTGDPRRQAAYAIRIELVVADSSRVAALRRVLALLDVRGVEVVELVVDDAATGILT